jgi:hypothetical protein
MMPSANFNYYSTTLKRGFLQKALIESRPFALKDYLKFHPSVTPKATGFISASLLVLYKPLAFLSAVDVGL